MREILFRGKRTDNGEWVEGYLVKFGKESFCDNDRYGIMEDTTLIAKVVTDNKGSSLIMRECDYVYHNVKVTEVIPETIGQFTGLTDKNGKKIWEGDVLVIRNNREYPVVVKFLDFGWCCVIPNVNAYIDYRHRLENNDTKYEVIGNITDNPELLKGGVEE